ncbi:hypothetical protein QCA50_003431 [Cerrena zonata]|uniref:Uncharacterized protein n=1 Tax=Cerrena zonata TaxID=2478898 RepID=A0AAW0GTX1_9APHY
MTRQETEYPPLVSDVEQKKRKATLERARATYLSGQLRLRLQYAKLKVDHGWQRQNLNEVENLYFRHSHMRKPKTRQSHPVLGTSRPSAPMTVGPPKLDGQYKPNMTPFEVRSVNQKRIDELLGNVSPIVEPPPPASPAPTEIFIDSQETQDSQESQQSQISITDMLLPDPSLSCSPSSFTVPEDTSSVPSSSSSQVTNRSLSPQKTSSMSSLMQVDGPAPSPFAVRSSSIPSIPTITTTSAPTLPNLSQLPLASSSSMASSSYSSTPLYPQQVPVTLSYQGAPATNVIHGPHSPITAMASSSSQSNPFANRSSPSLSSASGTALTYDSFWSSHASATNSYRHLLGINGTNSADAGVMNGGISGPSAGTS